MRPDAPPRAIAAAWRNALAAAWFMVAAAGACAAAATPPSEAPGTGPATPAESAAGVTGTEQEDQFRLTAETMQAQPPVAIARGNARLVSGEWTLTADEIRYNHETREAIANGHVLITRPGLRLLSESAHYWPAEGRIAVENFRFGQPPYYIAGERAHGDRETLVGENVVIHYGEPGPLTPHATATTLTLHADDTFSASALRFHVGAFPLFAFTGISRPLAQPNIDWETRAGFNSTVGLHAGAGVYVPWRPRFSPGGSIDLFSKRGVLFGPGARYGGGDEAGTSSGLTGAIDIAYINDTGDTGVDILGRPIEDDRSFGTWRHRQHGRQWTLTGAMDWWSDSEVTRDFLPRAFETNQEPDNFVEAGWYGRNTIVSALVRARPNDFQIVPERLPEVRVDLLPTPLGPTGWLFEGEMSAAALREKPRGNNDAPGRNSDRLDAYLGLSRTFPIAPGTTFTPVLGGRVTHYFDAEGGRDHYTRWLGEVGFDSRLRAYRTWDFERPLWGIDGIRHVVEPYVSYRYVPEADRGRPYIPVIDGQVFLPQMRPLGLAGRRDLDELGEIDVLRIGVRNYVETRREDYGSRRVLRLDAGADVFFDESHAGNRVPDLYAELLLTPADWLSWWFYLRIDPEEPWVNEFNSRFSIIAGRSWSAGLGIDFLRDSVSQYLLFGRYALSEANAILAEVRYDGREGRFNDVEVGFVHRLHQNWEFAASVYHREGTRRESGIGVRADLSFLAF